MAGASARFRSRLVAASLSGESDAAWAAGLAAHVDAAFLGGVALDEPTRRAASRMIDRERTEFLPADPVGFVATQLDAVPDTVRAGFNVRTTTLEPLREVASVCADRDAVVEINAHCRQDEMCAAGAGQSLLRDADRLCEQVAAASESGATVSAKLRTEVPGVDLPALAPRLERAGADVLHVDAMDSEAEIEAIAAATDCAVIANNGVRDRATVREYLRYGADAVSVGRPTREPARLAPIRAAVEEWFA